MVKRCKVLINNKAVTVIDYEGVLVQLPSIHRKTNYINVILEDGFYKVVEDDYKESKDDTDKPIIQADKKTTLEKKPNKKVKNPKEDDSFDDM